MSTTEYTTPRFGTAQRPALGTAAAIRQVPADVWVLGALVALAAAIRIVTIDNQSLWMDEALTAYEAHLPFGAMVNTVAHVETTPPLYFVLIWLWAKVFGTGAVALRAISTLAGIALVPIAYLSARELVSRWAGVVAAALVTLNPFLIWYSQEARAYMLVATLTGASFLWFVRARQDPSRRNLAWWAACSSLAVMTHFFAGFAIAPEALWLLWLARTRVVVIAVAVVGAFQAAMLPLAFFDSSHDTIWIAGVPRALRISGMLIEWGVSLLYRRSTQTQGFVGAAILLAIVGALLAFGGDRRTRLGAAPGAVIAAFVLLAPIALGLIGQDYFLSRNVIPAFLPLVTVVAAACVVPRARVLGAALAIGLLAMFAIATARVQTTPYYQRPNWRAVATALGTARVPRAIFAAGGETADPLKLYLPGVSWTQPRDRVVSIREIDVVGSKGRALLASTASRRSGRTRAPLRRYGSPLPRSVAPRGARLLSRVRVQGWTVARYELRHPIRISINRLIALAPKYFTHVPSSLFVFTAPRSR
jgi:hypothetical protein